MTTTKQFCTFFIGQRMYGVDVMRVQEITKALPMTKVPLAPKFIHGLINLRGQISTAIGLRELFDMKEPAPAEQMNVVCKLSDVLVSFLVDQIGDVMELEQKDFEHSPETVPNEIRRFINGVYKTPHALISIIDVDKIAEFFFRNGTQSSQQNQNL